MRQVMTDSLSQVKPFLKWAGGKRWLVQQHSRVLPRAFKTYYEPFLGSAVVFFHLLPSRAVLSDTNEDLIKTYIAIRSDWARVWNKLKHHQKLHSHEHYYLVRRSKPRSLSGKAARFIYLNRTCFNGLYRVNRTGKFNVPKGTKDKVIYPDDNFEALSRSLGTCKLIVQDFASVIARAKRYDLIYVDPPYTVKHNNNNFLKYNERIFSWHDQLRLADALHAASKRGAKIILSNADHPSIIKLYSDFQVLVSVSRNSMLAADASKRKTTTELLITNFRI